MEDGTELIPGFRVREASADEFAGLREQWLDALYPDVLAARRTALVDGQGPQTAGADLLRHHLVVETDDAEGEFVGWAVGRQASPITWRMNNTAVRPEYRRRGIYTALCQRVCAQATADGFAVAESRHHPTNTAILVAKLKLGFYVAGYELSVPWGTLVQLERPLTEAYRELFHFRCGAAPLDPQLAHAAGLSPLRDPS